MESAIDAILKIEDAIDTREVDTVLLIKNRFQRLNILQSQGTESGEYISRETNRILRDLLDTVNRIEDYQKAIPLSLPVIQDYLEILEAYILEVFRQDQYIMLDVSESGAEDKLTAWSIEKALDAAIDIKVISSGRKQGTPRPIEEIISGQRLTTVLGGAGIGKTTSLRYLVIQQLLRLKSNESQLVPVWIELDKWDDSGISVQAFIEEQLRKMIDNVPFPFEELLQAGKLMIFLDGLNEIPQRDLSQQSEDPSKEEKISREDQAGGLDPRENSLLTFARDSRCQIIISCRPSEYTHYPGWREYNILPLNPDQQAEFIRKYLGGKSEALDEILATRPQLKGLLKNPFYLRTMIRLLQENWEKVPDDQYQLVEYMCISAVYREAKKLNLPVDKVLDQLGRLSLFLMDRGIIGSASPVSIPPDQTVVEENTWKIAKGAGLIRREKMDQGQYAFRYLHQLIQESLALFYQKNRLPDKEKNRYAKALFLMGDIHRNWGKLAEARSNFQRALELCPLATAPELRGQILIALTQIYRAKRNSKRAEAFIIEAVEILQSPEPIKLLQQAYHEWGWINVRLKNKKKARFAFRKALELAREIGEEKLLILELLDGLGAFLSLTWVYQCQKSIEVLKEALQRAEAIPDEKLIASCKRQLARTYRVWGRMDLAEQMIHKAIKGYEQLKLRYATTRSKYLLALIKQDVWEFDAANRLLTEVLKFAEERQSLGLIFDAIIWGPYFINIRQQNYETAQKHLEQARNIAKRLSDPRYMMNILSYEASHYWLSKQFSVAADKFLALNRAIDEEYKTHMSFLTRAAIAWAKLAKVKGPYGFLVLNTAYLGRILLRQFRKLSKPTNRVGRFFWRIGMRYL